MPEWLRHFILNSIQFEAGDSAGGGGDGGQSTDADESGSEPKYTQKERDEFVQRAVDSVVGKERARSERAIKKAQDDAVEEWCKRNEVSADALDEFLAWREGKQTETTEAAKELRATKRRLSELEAELSKDRERADKYQGIYRESLTIGDLRKAAEQHKAVKPDEVVAILRSRVGLDEDEQVYVRGDNGKPVHGMTVDKLVQEYLTENDHLVLSQAPDGGAGSRTARTDHRPAQGDEPQSIREVLTEMAAKGVSPLD